MQFVDRFRQDMGWCPNTRSSTEKWCPDDAGYTVPVTESERPPSPDFIGNRKNEKYRHTQTGIVLASALVIGVLGTLSDILTHGIIGVRFISILFLLLMAGLLLTSTTLTVVITDWLMEIYLGPLPLQKRTIYLSEIISVRVEKDALHKINKAVWYLLPGAGLPGRTGVVIEQKGGKTFWIGSDEPELLVKAINHAIH